MKNDTTTLNPSNELSNEELQSTRGGLVQDPTDDPGGPTGRPSVFGPDSFRVPKLDPRDPRVFLPPPYRAPGDKPQPGETPPIIVVPVA
jgi:hypothetical protein